MTTIRIKLILLGACLPAGRTLDWHEQAGQPCPRRLHNPVWREHLVLGRSSRTAAQVITVAARGWALARLVNIADLITT